MDMSVETTIYTVGHSNHSIERFLSILQAAEVTAIADVRSQPFSRYNPQFNRGALREVLRAHGIAYAFVGKELGARPGDPSCYERGQVQYGRLAATVLFKAGLDRVMAASHKYRIALMCAEKEPLVCHRTLLVGQALKGRGVNLVHILANGDIEPDDDAMRRLLDMTGVPSLDLFRTPDELLQEAMARQVQGLTYSDDKQIGDINGDVE